MSIAFPRIDILTNVGFVDQDFPLVHRQEFGGRWPNGEAYAVNYGSALWMPIWTTELLLNDVAVDFETDLSSLDGVIKTFEAFDWRRPKPRAHKDGSGNNGTLSYVTTDRRSIALWNLAAGQTVSKGDYLSFDYGSNRALHRAEETVVANGSGATALFRVQPLLRPGWTIGAAVNVKAPRGLFTLVPGPQAITRRMQSGKFTAISFQAVQFLKRETS